MSTGGVSAGGQLSALAAVSCRASGLEPRQPSQSYGPDTKPVPITVSHLSDCVQARVAWYGVFDMATIADQSRTDKAMSRDVASAFEWQLLGCFGSRNCTPQQIATGHHGALPPNAGDGRQA